MVLWVGWSSKHIFLAADSFTLQFLNLLLFFCLTAAIQWPRDPFSSSAIRFWSAWTHNFLWWISWSNLLFPQDWPNLLISTPGTILKKTRSLLWNWNRLTSHKFDQFKKARFQQPSCPMGSRLESQPKCSWRILKLADIPTFKRWFPQQKRQQEKGSKRWRPQLSEQGKISLFIIQLLDDYCLVIPIKILSIVYRTKNKW